MNKYILPDFINFTIIENILIKIKQSNHKIYSFIMFTKEKNTYKKFDVYTLRKKTKLFTFIYQS